MTFFLQDLFCKSEICLFFSQSVVFQRGHIWGITFSDTKKQAHAACQLNRVCHSDVSQPTLTLDWAAPLCGFRQPITHTFILRLSVCHGRDIWHQWQSLICADPEEHSPYVCVCVTCKIRYLAFSIPKDQSHVCMYVSVRDTALFSTVSQMENSRMFCPLPVSNAFHCPEYE